MRDSDGMHVTFLSSVESRSGPHIRKDTGRTSREETKERGRSGEEREGKRRADRQGPDIPSSDLSVWNFYNIGAAIVQLPA